MRNCFVCRKRPALQEVAYEESLMFLCAICLNRMETEFAALSNVFENEEEEMHDFEDEEDSPVSISQLGKEFKK